MKSTFAVVEPGQELTWTGVSAGARAVHRHILDVLDGKNTRAVTEESPAGPLLVLFFSRAKLRATLETWLSGLKAAADQQPDVSTVSRAAASTSPGNGSSPHPSAGRASRAG